jgi:tRNA(His) guanylyltransferase
MSNKTLAERMKAYEKCYEVKIPERSYIILRLDGKNFSKFTKMFDKPFDKVLSDVMDMATKELCEELIPKFAYTQSDEVSLMFTDLENINSDMIFEGKIQKLCSIAAAKFTASFNRIMLRMLMLYKGDKFDDETILNKIKTGKFDEINAVFDARVFVIPDFREVSNYFIFRQQDATRNTMAAGSVYSHKELHGKSGSEKQEMLFQKGINWNEYSAKFKRGSVIKKGQLIKAGINGNVMRSPWGIDNNTPIFTIEPEYLYNLIPTIIL